MYAQGQTKEMVCDFKSIQYKQSCVLIKYEEVLEETWEYLEINGQWFEMDTRATHDTKLKA